MRTSRFLSLYYVVHLKLYIRLSPIVRLKLSRQKIQIKKISCRQLDKHTKVCGLASRRVSSQKEPKGEKIIRDFFALSDSILSSWCVVLVRHTFWFGYLFHPGRGQRYRSIRTASIERWSAAAGLVRTHTHTLLSPEIFSSQRVKSNLFPLIFTLFKQQFRKGGWGPSISHCDTRVSWIGRPTSRVEMKSKAGNMTPAGTSRKKRKNVDEFRQDMAAVLSISFSRSVCSFPFIFFFEQSEK